MLHLSIRAQRTTDNLVSFPRLEQFLVLVDVATHVVFFPINTQPITPSCVFNLSLKYTFCVFQTFYHNENMTFCQVLIWKSLFMEAM